MKKIIKSLLIGTATLFLLLLFTTCTEFDVEIKMSRGSKLPLFFMPECPGVQQRYYDANSSVISWENVSIAPPFKEDDYHKYVDTEEFLEITISGTRRRLLDNDTMSGRETFSKILPPIYLNDAESTSIANPEPDDFESDYFLKNSSYYYYRIKPETFPAMIINSRDYLTLYDFTIEVTAKYTYIYYFIDGTLMHSTYTRASDTSGHFYIFNEKPAIPKNVQIRYKNWAFPSSDGEPAAVYNVVGDNPPDAGVGPDWAGPETDLIEVIWDTPFRFRKPSYRLYLGDQLLKNSDNIDTIEAPINYNHTAPVPEPVPDYPNLYYSNFVVENTAPVRDSSKEN